MQCCLSVIIDCPSVIHPLFTVVHNYNCDKADTIKISVVIKATEILGQLLPITGENVCSYDHRSSDSISICIVAVMVGSDCE